MSSRVDQPTRDTRFLRPVGQNHGTHDHPVELASADDAFLHVLVVIDAPQQQMERRAIKKPPAGRQPTGSFPDPSLAQISKLDAACFATVSRQRKRSKAARPLRAVQLLLSPRRPSRMGKIFRFRAEELSESTL